MAFLVSYPVLLPLCLWSAARFCRGAEESTDPRSVSVAMQMPRGPAILRPVMATWWVALAFALLLLARSMIRELDTPALHNTRSLEAINVAAGVLWAFAAANAVHNCILFAIAALYRNERLIAVVHKFRVVLDILLIALAASLPEIKMP